MDSVVVHPHPRGRHVLPARATLVICVVSVAGNQARDPGHPRGGHARRRTSGQILELERLTIEELLDAAGEQGISDLGHLKVGVLEPDGKFSFLKDERRREKA